ncbi:MAG: AraC family transcriptional regulator [Lachnospiraceae bacterium]|nr:AraC family transcriptional regulator [Lachnospiraceae bacterium]
MQYMNYRESWQRGTADFPVEFHHITPQYPQYYMPLHWHVEYELIRVLEGCFQIILDGQSFETKAGTSILIPAGILQEGIPRDCIYQCIVFDINMLINNNDSCCQILRKVMDREVLLENIYATEKKQIHQTVWSIFDALGSKQQGYQMIVLGGLYQLFGHIFTQGHYQEAPTQTKGRHRKIRQLKTALEFMESNFNTALSLAEMASSVNMSAKYFCRFFKELTHRTPLDYLNYYRIERACYQMLTEHQSVTEIAFHTGFNDLSYFIKTFKKYKGVTPKEYLKI